MSDGFEDQGWVKMGVAAYMTRQYSQYQREFFERLAAWLERSLPEATEIQKRGGLFSKKTVCKISVKIDGLRYVLEDPGKGALRAACTHIVRGIVLKTEELPVEVWVAALGEALEKMAGESVSARDALKQMLE